jgi:DNA-binding transcriptional regulator LsrR (DeoR family)
MIRRKEFSLLRKRKLKPDEVRRLVDAYVAGVQMEIIGRRFNISRDTVREYLKKARAEWKQQRSITVR